LTVPPLQKYLAGYAEPEAALANELPSFDHVICVPACGESPDFLDDLAPALDDRVLVIVVVNGTEGDDRAAAANDAMLEALTRGASRIASAPPSWLRADPPCLVIDRATDGRHVPVKQSVGLARKIAADVACAMFAAGKLTSRWIHMTDCDVQLPSDYLSASPDDGVLLTYPYRHVAGGEAEIDTAHAIYEVFLRYYVLGLCSAGSRYAMHTIGSTLATEVNAYAAVRGMPKRQAAEDFYLVNKVAKLGRVMTPNSEPLRIVARRSLRVPFGTGRSTAKIAETGGRDFYHPAVFTLLGAWLSAIDHLAEVGKSPTDMALSLVEHDAHRAILRDALTALDAERTLTRAIATAPPNFVARQNRAHEHFDAFRTRKLVHLLRDGGLGELPWRQALAEASFVDVAQDDPFTICEALAASEGCS
jgi:hypothetical protein